MRRRSYEEYRKEAEKILRKLINYRKNIDSSHPDLFDIERSIEELGRALRLAEFYHEHKKYSKAIDVLENALDNAYYTPFLELY